MSMTCRDAFPRLPEALVVHARLVTRENEIRFLRELKQPPAFESEGLKG